MAEGPDLPVQPVSSRTRLVAEVQFLVARRQLANQLDHSFRSVVQFAKIANLAAPTALCHRDRIPRLCRIDSNKSLTKGLTRNKRIGGWESGRDPY